MISKRKRAKALLAQVEGNGDRIDLYDRDIVLVTDNIYSQEFWAELDEVRDELVEMLLQRDMSESE